MEGVHGHTWAGILYFDVPLGLLLVFIYHLVVRNGLINNLPDFLGSRMRSHGEFHFPEYFSKHWFIVLVSLAAGAFTHVLWDSFTHNSTIFTAHSTFFQSKLYLFFEEYPLYHILQHVSTGVGFGIVLTAFLCLPRYPVPKVPSRGYWPGIIILSLLIFSVRIAFMDHEVKIGHVVVSAIAAVMYALVFISIIYRSRYA